MITAQDIEQAEKVLKVRGEAGGMRAVHESADVDSRALGRFCEHHIHNTLPKSYPDLDPRLIPALDTLFAHSFMAGVLCGRGEERSRANG